MNATACAGIRKRNCLSTKTSNPSTIVSNGTPLPYLSHPREQFGVTAHAREPGTDDLLNNTRQIPQSGRGAWMRHAWRGKDSYAGIGLGKQEG